MSPADFRRIALEMDGACEGKHMGHPDFRVSGKIFATLGYPDEGSAVVLLAPDEQAVLVRAAPRVFSPVKGGWGRRGSTRVALAAVDVRTLRNAIKTAWQRRAPKKSSVSARPAKT
jgi:hypothetical protein